MKFAPRKRTGEAPHRTGPTPQAPPRRMVSSAALGETEEVQPLLGASSSRETMTGREWGVFPSFDLKASQTSTFPRIKFVTAGFGEDKYPCFQF
jgi:hypothetical protein